jgi:signal transduction histidine kinase
MREAEHFTRTEPSAETVRTLDAIARVVGTAAHDFNNLLMTAMGYADLLRLQLPEDSRHRNDAQSIVDATTRAGQLCRQLLAFAQRQQLRPRNFGANDRLLQLKPKILDVLGEGISLRMALDQNIREIRCDPGHFDLMVLELAANAARAMKSSGVFSIISRAGEEHAVFEFADDGPGMAAESLERAFEPFFTTGPKRLAQGLGLSSIYGFALQSGGAIELRPVSPHGLLVEVRLPRGEA